MKNLKFHIDNPLQKIIHYLENTKDEQWCVSVCATVKKEYCVMGHIFNIGGSWLWDWFEECIATEFMIFSVNDGHNKSYQQATPKERCIAYLKDVQSGKVKTSYELMQEHFG